VPPSVRNRELTVAANNASGTAEPNRKTALARTASGSRVKYSAIVAGSANGDGKTPPKVVLTTMPATISSSEIPASRAGGGPPCGRARRTADSVVVFVIVRSPSTSWSVGTPRT